MTIRVRFRDEDWERLRRSWEAWWAGDLDRALIILEYTGPPEPDSPPGPVMGNRPAHFPLETPAEQVVDYYQDILERRHYFLDAWPKWWPDFGPGIAAGFLGAQVRCTPETIWFDPPASLSIEHLNLTYNPENVWWRRVVEITSHAAERWGDQVCLGHTDLGGNLDILASLRSTNQLLLDLYDAPSEVARLVKQITGYWLRYYDELYELVRLAGRGTTPWAGIWSSGRCYMLQSDFSYMISPWMFERYVLPDLAACCAVLDQGFYHLDGKGQLPHLDLLLSLDELCGIQWVPGDGNPDPEGWPALLRKILGAGKRCQLNVTFEGACTILRELGGHGLALSIKNEPESLFQAEAMAAELEDLNQQG